MVEIIAGTSNGQHSIIGRGWAKTSKPPHNTYVRLRLMYRKFTARLSMSYRTSSIRPVQRSTMVARTEARMASVFLACLLGLLAPLRVATQCTPLGVAVEFVAPSDSGHQLVTEDSEVAKNTALCHVACLNQLLGGDNMTNGTLSDKSTTNGTLNGANITNGSNVRANEKH